MKLRSSTKCLTVWARSGPQCLSARTYFRLKSINPRLSMPDLKEGSIFVMAFRLHLKNPPDVFIMMLFGRFLRIDRARPSVRLGQRWIIRFSRVSVTWAPCGVTSYRSWWKLVKLFFISIFLHSWWFSCHIRSTGLSDALMTPSIPRCSDGRNRLFLRPSDTFNGRAFSAAQLRDHNDDVVHCSHYLIRDSASLWLRGIVRGAFWLPGRLWRGHSNTCLLSPRPSFLGTPPLSYSLGN